MSRPSVPVITFPDQASLTTIRFFGVSTEEPDVCVTECEPYVPSDPPSIATTEPVANALPTGIDGWVVAIKFDGAVPSDTLNRAKFEPVATFTMFRFCDLKRNLFCSRSVRSELRVFNPLAEFEPDGADTASYHDPETPAQRIFLICDLIAFRSD